MSFDIRFSILPILAAVPPVKPPAACKPTTPVQVAPGYEAGDYQTCGDSVEVVLDPFNIVPLPNGRSGDFARFLKDNSLDIYKLDQLTWEHVANYVYSDEITSDPAMLKAVVTMLKEANGGAERPYDTITTAQGASYRYYRFALGESFLGGLSCILPNAGGIPKMTIIVPKPPVDNCSDIRQPTIDLEKAIASLEQRKNDVIAEVTANSKLIVVLTYITGTKEQKTYGAEALEKVEEILNKARALLKEATDMIADDCDKLGNIEARITSMTTKVTETEEGLNVEQKPEPEVRRPSGKKPSGKKPSGKKPSGKKPEGKKPGGKKPGGISPEF